VFRRLFKREGKDAPKPPQKKGSKSDNTVVRYFQDTRDELRKVAWPSREETVRLTLIVLGTTLVFSIFLGALDFLFQRLAGLFV
jgi:preprotein translocase subunit SecE